MRDEDYIIEICTNVLNSEVKPQHRFDFLRGDKAKRKNGQIIEIIKNKGRKLRVDAFYEEHNLVIEYLEIQHFKPVKHFDKPEKITVSGVSRNEQRKLYDQRRRDVLAAKGISLIEFHYNEFKHNNSGRLIQCENDKLVIKKKLAPFLS